MDYAFKENPGIMGYTTTSNKLKTQSKSNLSYKGESDFRIRKNKDRRTKLQNKSVKQQSIASAYNAAPVQVLGGSRGGRLPELYNVRQDKSRKDARMVAAHDRIIAAGAKTAGTSQNPMSASFGKQSAQMFHKG